MKRKQICYAYVWRSYKVAFSSDKAARFLVMYEMDKQIIVAFIETAIGKQERKVEMSLNIKFDVNII